MRYRKLTPSGDYSFGNGQLDFWRDVPEAVGQVVLTGLRLWLGEWYLNILDGVPYIQGVLGKHSQTEADITIQDAILGFQGVVDIQNFKSVVDPQTRKYSVVEVDVDTIFGPTSVQVANYANF